ncbi:nucleoside triphosphate pyrophosphohydrolase family protein [Nocardiopsis aegyptia]|uniref:NTP pyrophosphatase (Non-canonical NTP hydrolase) n=1 Tax=Nocardiopsis aegyptia TaxID=220378 RepID=A0A7Z0JA68_9ACTN|nr:pyrophosphatase [Nocardiopsis aegyptia]NYJ34801.1 NTP pyrophosphatase (non-canonical NTP hydrolase) [Nocardiopsis aegyptia]
MDVDRLTAEVEHVSRAYAARFGIERDADWFVLKLHEEMGELTQAFLALDGRGRAKGLDDRERSARFRAELADVFCHVLLLADHHGVDLTAEVRAKWLDRWGASQGSQRSAQGLSEGSVDGVQ